MSETRPLSSSPTNSVFTRIEKLITNEDGLEWLRLLFQLDDGATHILDDRRAHELIARGICGRAPEGISLTPFGRKCADSVREYIFWIERHKKIHWEDKYQCLKLENFHKHGTYQKSNGLGQSSLLTVFIEVVPPY